MSALEYNIEQGLLVRGMSCFVRVGNSAADAEVVGFTDSFSATKNIQTQDAMVTGSPVPASIDAMGIQVTLSMSGFLASKDVYDGTKTFNGGGTVSLSSFNPDDDAFVMDQVITKFPYIDFYDKKKQAIMASFSMAIPTSYGINVNAGAYNKVNVQMKAIKMSGGKDYQSTITG